MKEASISFKSIPKDEEPFNYKEIAKDLWYERFNDACKNFKIKFDLENNDSKKEKKKIVIKDGDNEWIFNCELMAAGGDWECSNLYFKCQFIDGYLGGYDDKEIKLPYPSDLSTGRKSYFVLIPPLEAGNNNLVKLDKSEDYEYGSIQDGNGNDLDNKKAWKWVQKYLEDYVNEFVKKSK